MTDRIPLGQVVAYHPRCKTSHQIMGECPVPTFHLSDDGTLDTVVTCDRCGQDERYTFQGDGDETYDEYVTYALEDAAIDHECKA